jgi:hypothetical protein
MQEILSTVLEVCMNSIKMPTHRGGIANHILPDACKLLQDAFDLSWTAVDSIISLFDCQKNILQSPNEQPAIEAPVK